MLLVLSSAIQVGVNALAQPQIPMDLQTNAARAQTVQALEARARAEKVAAETGADQGAEAGSGWDAPDSAERDALNAESSPRCGTRTCVNNPASWRQLLGDLLLFGGIGLMLVYSERMRRN